MQCDKVKKLISEYIDGELSPKTSREIKEHLGKCEKCSILANTLKATVLFSHEIETLEIAPQSIYYNLHKVLRKEWEFYTEAKEIKVRVGSPRPSPRSCQLDAPQRMYANLVEQDNALILIIELPGVEKGNIQLVVGGNTVEISGIKENPIVGTNLIRAKRAEGTYIKRACYINEIKYGEFFRKIELPYQIVPERTKSSFKNGLLKVKLLKI